MMTSKKLKNYENMCYATDTSYASEFKRRPIQPTVRPIRQATIRPPTPHPRNKETEPEIPYFPTNCESLVQYKKHVDFTLFHKPKGIIRTNPMDVQKPYIEYKVNQEKARRTRPRLVMTPAVSLDDFQDPAIHDVLIDDIYLSSFLRSAREVKAPPLGIKAQLPAHPSPATPISLPKLKPKWVPEEWRLDSVGWDRRQLRGHCETDKEFWKRMNTICKPCEQTAQVKKLRQMGRLL